MARVKLLQRDSYNRSVSDSKLDSPLIYLMRARLPVTLDDIVLREKINYLHLRNARILVDGCGSGVSGVDILGLQGHEVIGIDISGVSVKRAKYYSKELRFNSHFVVCDAENLPFRGEMFEGIISIFLLEHVPNPEAVLGEVSRVLKREGSFLISTNNKDFKFTYPWFFKKLFPRKYTLRLGTHSEDRYLRLSEILSILENKELQATSIKLHGAIFSFIYDNKVWPKISKFLQSRISKTKNILDKRNTGQTTEPDKFKLDKYRLFYLFYVRVFLRLMKILALPDFIITKRGHSINMYITGLKPRKES